MEFTGWRARPTGLSRFFYRAPLALHHAGLGGLLGKRFVLVHHVGRRSGLPREALVETVHVQEGPDGPASVTVASGFGPKTDWYLNLRAHPAVTIELGARTLAVTAVHPDPEEAAVLVRDCIARGRLSKRGGTVRRTPANSC